ncbi:chemotaxis protein CheB [Amycolatopsis jiangsuensis]|uniref:protein-glutamate methylesterase n=1 Tax=Amycolatopsis jiangsuensis TaxID=1181879 RepID=A0A840J6I5_9PSEU|nr:chemotaxis protein CheB [Amycolatopsis jiangsuensis]MBB4689215.1 two-component system chemotaxis response regulator CheB [Amycolatopsis jiangsuensis]
MGVRRDLVVLGASAGGVAALRSVVAGLPADLPAAVLVTMPVAHGGGNVLAAILDRAGPLPAVTAEHGAPVTPGTIQVAPAGRHLLLADRTLVLSAGPAENGHRPAVDATFRSAAITAGPRAIGVVLSGVLDDGAAGLRALAERHGVALVQDPADAVYAGLPERALSRVPGARVLRAEAIGPAVDALTREPWEPPPVPPPAPELLLEDRIARQVPGPGITGAHTHSAGLSCPDCEGAMVWTNSAGNRFRCRIGHSWTAEALVRAQQDEYRRALEVALRALDEKASLAAALEDRSRQHGHPAVTERYAARNAEARRTADTLRRFIADAVEANAVEAGPAGG